MCPSDNAYETADDTPALLSEVDVSKAPEALQKDSSLLRLYACNQGCVEEDEVLTKNPIIMYTQDELCAYSALRILYCISTGATNFALPTGTYRAGMPATVLQALCDLLHIPYDLLRFNELRNHVNILLPPTYLSHSDPAKHKTKVNNK